MNRQRFFRQTNNHSTHLQALSTYSLCCLLSAARYVTSEDSFVLCTTIGAHIFKVNPKMSSPRQILSHSEQRRAFSPQFLEVQPSGSGEKEKLYLAMSIRSLTQNTDNKKCVSKRESNIKTHYETSVCHLCPKTTIFKPLYFNFHY